MILVPRAFCKINTLLSILMKGITFDDNGDVSMMMREMVVVPRPKKSH